MGVVVKQHGFVQSGLHAPAFVEPDVLRSDLRVQRSEGFETMSAAGIKQGVSLTII